MRVARQFLALILTRWMLLALAFATSVTIARTLGPENQGILTLIVGSVNILAVGLVMGLPSSAAYLFKRRDYSVGELMSGIALYFAAVTALCLAALGWGGGALRQALAPLIGSVTLEADWLWLALGLLPGILVTSVLNALLVVGDRLDSLMSWNIGGQGVRLLLTWLLVVLLHRGVSGALVANLVMQSLALAILVYWLRSFATGGALRLRLGALTATPRIGFKQYLVTLFANLFKRGEGFLLAILADVNAVGYYSVASGIYDLVIDVPRNLVWPMVGELADKDRHNPAVRAAQGGRMQLPLSVGLIVGAGLIVPILIPIVYGQEYAAAVIPFILLLPGVMFRTLYLAASAYFIVIGTPGALIVPVMASAAVGLRLDVLVIPRFGVAGAATTTVLGEIAMATLSVREFLRRGRVSIKDALVPRRAELQQLLTLPGALPKRSSGGSVGPVSEHE